MIYRNARAPRGAIVASVSLLALGLGAPQSAAAQTAASPSADQGTQASDDIVVTAQRREQNLQDVPIAVTAVDSRYLESRDISSLDQIGAIAPNLKIERTPGNKTVSQIAIRGSVTINPAITFEPAVGLYLNGVYIAKAQGSLFDVADLERVEVLRGPQGTLYGRNTLAGAVSLVTKKPTGEFGGNVEATYGNYNARVLRGNMDLPRVGPFSVKLSGQVKKRDGMVETVPNPYPQAVLARPNSVDSVDNINSWGVAADVRGELTDRLTVDYFFDHSKTDQRPQNSQLVRVNRNGDPRDIFDPSSPGYAFGGAFFPLNLYVRPDRQSTASLDSPLFERSTVTGHALTAEYKLGEVSLKSITAWRAMTFDDSLDLDGSPLPVANTERHSRYHSFSQELQLIGETGPLSYVLGGYYFRDSGGTINPQTFFGGAQVYDSRYASQTRAYAAFGQVDWKILPNFTLTGGLRYSQESKNITRLFRILASPDVPAVALPLTVLNVQKGDVPDAKFHAWTPTAIATYQPSKDVTLYAKYARGFKSGGFNGETSSLAELLQPYKAETVDSYELGLKSRALDHTLTFNAALFWNEAKNMQLSVFTGRNAAESFILNAGAARLRGVELEMIARPAPSLQVTTSFSYLDAKYKKFIDGGVDVSDNRALPHAPKYNVSVGTDWSPYNGSAGKLDLIADLSFVSSYFTYPYPLRAALPSDQTAYGSESPGRTIVNLRAALTRIPLAGVQGEISVWGRNVFNDVSPSNFIDFGPGFGGLTVAYFNEPATYGMTLGVRF
ncbi:MAG: TonB-dependent receptor [Candidatus Sphingomonas colombiensis]|nr:TonB-dependent receptor [Sphingomonas sp.]WEK42089.1 MAG: TonB-dependent receptor [Sphingomonas sp.]